MAKVNKNNTINYIELPMVKNAETKKFYHQKFEWEMRKYPIPVSWLFSMQATLIKSSKR